MRIEEIIHAIKAAKYSTMEGVFKTPPQTLEDFKKQLGFYQGLAEVERLIEEGRKKENGDD